ncbi:MAG: hypothetical protein ABJF10_26030 [Chthoniobacter sp.]|uniref:hypothetical protein n=1 Tax=Chthoniobacter sp. TaxID=2510640 RepID=UPI0032A8BB20
MSTATPAYRKIPGGGFSWKGHGRLWLAEDHLLEVTSILVLEQYRRFFFQEARAFVVQRTNLRLIWGWILGGAGAVLGLVAGSALWVALANSTEDWHIAFYFAAGPFGVGALFFLTLWVINLLLGPTCRCHLLTSTGWHALSAPTRMGPAGRAQAQIVSIIQTAQGPAPTPEAAVTP